MTQTRFDETACRAVRARLDSYLDNELLAESNLEVLEHFRSCPECNREAEARRKMRLRVQHAVRETGIPGGLAGLVRDRLREEQRPPSHKLRLMAIAAALVVCFGSGLAYWRGAEREAYIASVLRVGLRNHLHCAVGRQLTKPHGGGVNKLQGEFQNLTAVLHDRVPADLPLSVAHECTFQGRKFIHVTFRNERSIVSLILTRKQLGESLSAGTHTRQEGGYQLAAFESNGFLVYTVSDLDRDRNLELLAQFTPAIASVLPGAHPEHQPGG
jgi:anti-sigma factor RsiW